MARSTCCSVLSPSAPALQVRPPIQHPGHKHAISYFRSRKAAYHAPLDCDFVISAPRGLHAQPGSCCTCFALRLGRFSRSRSPSSVTPPNKSTVNGSVHSTMACRRVWFWCRLATSQKSNEKFGSDDRLSLDDHQSQAPVKQSLAIERRRLDGEWKLSTTSSRAPSASRSES